MKQLFLARDVWLLAALLIALAGFTAFVTVRQQEIQARQQISTPYSSHSFQSDGTLALYEWLARVGYRVERIENSAFQIGDTTRLLFILGPTETIRDNEAEYILQWVARGNTLVLADRAGFLNNSLLHKLNVEFDSLDARAERMTPTQPLMDSATGEPQVETYSALKFSKPDFVQYGQAQGKTVLARLPYGAGVIWLTSAPRMFTNDSLRRDANASFSAALVASVPRASAIAFDEYHLGFKPEPGSGFLDVLYDRPWGWGILFAFVLLFGYLAINGQRLGRAMPVPKTLARRSPAEYVTSMANLFRRANKRGMVLHHYRHSLKRRLARPFHLNPELSDERFVELITRLRPELDASALVQLLNSLRRTDTTEADLVKTIARSVTFGARAPKN